MSDPMEETEKDQCSICMEEFEGEKKAIYYTECGHPFHILCLAEWDNETCPLCRTVIMTLHDFLDKRTEVEELKITIEKLKKNMGKMQEKIDSYRVKAMAYENMKNEHTSMREELCQLQKDIDGKVDKKYKQYMEAKQNEVYKWQSKYSQLERTVREQKNVPHTGITTSAIPAHLLATGNSFTFHH